MNFLSGANLGAAALVAAILIGLTVRVMLLRNQAGKINQPDQKR